MRTEMQSGLLLNVVVGQGASIFELLASEDETLLIWGNSFFVLDLGLDVIDRITGLDLESDSLAGEGLNENLHATPQAEN